MLGKFVLFPAGVVESIPFHSESSPLAEQYYPSAFCDEDLRLGSVTGCRLWHFNMLALTWPRDLY